jgi:hypothetical protein
MHDDDDVTVISHLVMTGLNLNKSGEEPPDKIRTAVSKALEGVLHPDLAKLARELRSFGQVDPNDEAALVAAIQKAIQGPN